MPARSFKTGTCRGCGRAIVWAWDESGKAIPLDPRPPVYRVSEHPERSAPACTRLISPFEADGALQGFMVSHFATCPKANDFSGSRRPAPEPGPRRGGDAGTDT